MLSEREKISYIIGSVRATMDHNVHDNGDDFEHSIRTAKATLGILFREFGLRPKDEMLCEVINFESEINVISGILNKEYNMDGFKGSYGK